MNTRYNNLAGASLALATLGFVLLTSASASAKNYTVSYTLDSTQYTSWITGTINGVGYNENVYVSPLTAKWDVSPEGAPTDSFHVYCVDITHNETSPADVQPVVISSTAAWLLNAYDASVKNPASLPLLSVGDYTTAEAGAALQLAIWDTLPSTTFSYTPSGGDSGDWAKINSLYSTFTTAAKSANRGGDSNGLLLAASKDYQRVAGQDMIAPVSAAGTHTFQDRTAVTPEMPTIALLMGGLAPLAGLAFRRRNAASKA